MATDVLAVHRRWRFAVRAAFFTEGPGPRFALRDLSTVICFICSTVNILPRPVVKRTTGVCVNEFLVLLECTCWDNRVASELNLFVCPRSPGMSPHCFMVLTRRSLAKGLKEMLFTGVVPSVLKTDSPLCNSKVRSLLPKVPTFRKAPLDLPSHALRMLMPPLLRFRCDACQFRCSTSAHY